MRHIKQIPGLVLVLFLCLSVYSSVTFFEDGNITADDYSVYDDVWGGRYVFANMTSTPVDASYATEYIYGLNSDGSWKTKQFTDASAAGLISEINWDDKYFNGVSQCGQGACNVEAFNESVLNNTITAHDFVSASDWTTIDDYPSACSNQFMRGLGDTLTCATVDVSSDTNLDAVGLVELSGDTIQGNTSWAATFNIVGVNAATSGLSAGDVNISNNLYVSNSIDAPLIQGTGAISLKPSGDTDDYFKFETVSDVPRLTAMGGGRLELYSDGSSVRVYPSAGSHGRFTMYGESNLLRLYLSPADQGHLRLESYGDYPGYINTSVIWGYGANGRLDLIHETGSINMKPSGDTNDYLSFKTVSDIPRIGCEGCSDIYFRDSSLNWETVHAAEFTDEVAKNIEKELNQTRRNPLSYGIRRHGDKILGDNLPSSIVSTNNQTGEIESVNLGETAVYTLLAVEELRKENELLKTELCKKDQTYLFCGR